MKQDFSLASAFASFSSAPLRLRVHFGCGYAALCDSADPATLR